LTEDGTGSVWREAGTNNPVRRGTAAPVVSGTRTTAVEVRMLLQDQPLVLQGLDGGTVAPPSTAKLIREATVRDMQVVRWREWAGDVPER
jgi:hypothetical protein